MDFTFGESSNSSVDIQFEDMQSHLELPECVGALRDHYRRYAAGDYLALDYAAQVRNVIAQLEQHVESVEDNFLAPSATEPIADFVETPEDSSTDVIRDIGLAIRRYYERDNQLFDSPPETGALPIVEYSMPSEASELSYGMLWHVIANYNEAAIEGRVLVHIDERVTVQINGPERAQTIRFYDDYHSAEHEHRVPVNSLQELYMQEEDIRHIFDGFVMEPTFIGCSFTYNKQPRFYLRPFEDILQRYIAQAHAESVIAQRLNGAYFISDDGTEESEREIENRRNEEMEVDVHENIQRIREREIEWWANEDRGPAEVHTYTDAD